MSKKVIIIDDSATMLNVLNLTFIKGGWQVYLFQNAKLAFDSVCEIAPDLIITDALMSSMGGFQLLKLLREDYLLSKIPVVVYSVLDEKNAKFYIKKDSGEYFLNKSNNPEILLEFANDVVKKDVVADIFKLDMQTRQNTGERKNINKNTRIEYNFNKTRMDSIASSLKEISNSKYDKNDSFSEVFSVLHSIFEYDLACINLCFAENENIVYFDIKNIILSPVFQKNILNKYHTQKHVLFKKYVPNMITVMSEEDFSSKIDFCVEYKKKYVADFVFYFKKKKEVDDIYINELKNVLSAFLETIKTEKFFDENRKEIFNQTYLKNEFDLSCLVNNKELSDKESYVAVVSVANYSDLKTEHNQEDIDVINLKISEKLINMLGKYEQIYRNSDNEYNILVFADNEEKMYQKLCGLLVVLDGASFNGFHPNIVIGASKCNIEAGYNLFDVLLNAHNLLDRTDENNKVIIG